MDRVLDLMQGDGLMGETRDTHFKGWARPGPVAPGHAAGTTAGPGETLDALSGHWALFQLKDGHRFSTDDLLTAWYGSSWCPSARTVLDLGSGLGTVATICAWRLPGARLVTVEAQSQSVALARRSVVFNGLEPRYDIREGDFRDPGVLREDEFFDLVTGSPPYFPLGAGVESDHAQKLACRFELRGTVADYCGTAARHLAPGGFFACVFPAEAAQMERVVAGARFEARGYAAFLQNAGLFFWADSQGCTLGWYAMPRWGKESETWCSISSNGTARIRWNAMPGSGEDTGSETSSFHLPCRGMGLERR